MDWLTIVLILIFFVLPLIQQIAQQAKRGQQPHQELPGPPEDEDWDESPPRRPSRDTAAADENSAALPDGWSTEWTPWPTSEEPASQRAELPTPRESTAPRPHVPLPPIRPAPTAEPTRRTQEPATPRAAPRTAPAVTPPRPARVQATAAVRRAIAPRVAGLSNPGDLRRAIILTEVLGPPVSLRPPDRGPAS